MENQQIASAILRIYSDYNKQLGAYKIFYSVIMALTSASAECTAWWKKCSSLRCPRISQNAIFPENHCMATVRERRCRFRDHNLPESLPQTECFIWAYVPLWPRIVIKAVKLHFPVKWLPYIFLGITVLSCVIYIFLYHFPAWIGLRLA